MSVSSSNGDRNITVSLDNPITFEYQSSHESDWVDTDSDFESSSSMGSPKVNGGSGSRRVHFGQGSGNGNRGSPRGNRDNLASSSRRNDSASRNQGQVSGSEGAAAASSTNQSSDQNQNVNNNNNNNNNGAPDNSTNSASGVPGVQPYNNPHPITSTGQPLFTHHTGNNNLNRYNYPVFQLPGQQFPSANGYINGYPQQNITITQPFGTPVNGMSGYVNPANTGIHFQPQVPDTSNGPYVHTYHPRHDAPGQQQYYVQPVTTGGVAVPMQAGTIQAHPVTGPIPGQFIQQGYAGQPMMVAAGQPMQQGGHMVQQPVMVSGAPQYVAGMAPSPGYPSIPVQGVPAFFNQDPVLGIGKTGAEIMAEQMQFAHENGLFEPQDFKPADDDASRYWMVRELDNTWTQRNRATIDALGCRWFLTQAGVFYAVRLPES